MQVVCQGMSWHCQRAERVHAQLQPAAQPAWCCCVLVAADRPQQCCGTHRICSGRRSSPLPARPACSLLGPPLAPDKRQQGDRNSKIMVPADGLNARACLKALAVLLFAVALLAVAAALVQAVGDSALRAGLFLNLLLKGLWVALPDLLTHAYHQIPAETARPKVWLPGCMLIWHPCPNSRKMPAVYQLLWNIQWRVLQPACSQHCSGSSGSCRHACSTGRQQSSRSTA